MLTSLRRKACPPVRTQNGCLCCLQEPGYRRALLCMWVLPSAFVFVAICLPTWLLVFVLEVMHPATLICGISTELTGGILLAVKRICLGFAVPGKASPPNTLTAESSQELFMKKRAPDSGPRGHCLRTAPSSVITKLCSDSQ